MTEMSRTLKPILYLLFLYVCYCMIGVNTSPLADMIDEPEVEADAKMKNVLPCPGSENAKVRIDHAAVRRTGKRTVGLYADVIYDMDIQENDLWNIMLIVKFQQRGSSSTVPVLDIPMENICEMLKDDDNEQKEAYYKCIKGGLSRFCPITAGKYTLSNYTYDQKDLKPFLRDGTYFLRFNQTVNGQDVGCTEIEMDVQVKQVV